MLGTAILKALKHPIFEHKFFLLRFFLVISYLKNNKMV